MLCSPHVSQSLVFICDLLFIWKRQERRQKADHCYPSVSSLLPYFTLRHYCMGAQMEQLLCLVWNLPFCLEWKLDMSFQAKPSQSQLMFLYKRDCAGIVLERKSSVTADGWPRYWTGVLNHHYYCETIKIEPYNMGRLYRYKHKTATHTQWKSDIQHSSCGLMLCFKSIFMPRLFLVVSMVNRKVVLNVN